MMNLLKRLEDIQTDKIEHFGHEFYPAFHYKNREDEILGQYFCYKCNIRVFIGSKNPTYKRTSFDGKICHFDGLLNRWLENFNSCNEQIIKNLLE